MQKSIYEFVGGHDTFQRLVETFYAKVKTDDVLSRHFGHFTQEHMDHVAIWLSEVFGGPKRYTSELGGHTSMMLHHLALHFTEEERQRWHDLMIQSAHEVLPADEKLQERFEAYINWGTHFALGMSKLPKDTPLPDTPSPTWGWDNGDQPEGETVT